jgi:hypothetical protein
LFFILNVLFKNDMRDLDWAPGDRVQPGNLFIRGGVFHCASDTQDKIRAKMGRLAFTLATISLCAISVASNPSIGRDQLKERGGVDEEGDLILGFAAFDAHLSSSQEVWDEWAMAHASRRMRDKEQVECVPRRHPYFLSDCGPTHANAASADHNRTFVFFFACFTIPMTSFFRIKGFAVHHTRSGGGRL